LLYHTRMYCKLTMASVRHSVVDLLSAFGPAPMTLRKSCIVVLLLVSAASLSG